MRPASSRQRTSDQRRGATTEVWSLLTVLPTLLLLGACADCTRDPRQAGFFCGVSNLATGTYKEDTAQLEREAVSAERQVAELRADNARLDQEIRSLAAEERSLRQRQRKLNDQLAASIRRVEDLKRRQRGAPAELATLERRVAELTERQRELARAPVEQVSQADIARLEQENAELRKLIDRLLAATPS